MNHLKVLEKQLLDKIEIQQKNGGKPLPSDSFYVCVRRAWWLTFRFDLITSAFYSFTGECCAIGFTTSLIFLINFIKNDDAELKEGIIYLMAFGILMFLSVYCKNTFIWTGQINSTRMRKTLIAAMYRKISKLSMKSLTQTNSGKLITIVSGEI